MLAHSGSMIIAGDKINKTSNVLYASQAVQEYHRHVLPDKYCKKAMAQSTETCTTSFIFYNRTTGSTFLVDFRTLTLLNVMTGLG